MDVDELEAARADLERIDARLRRFCLLNAPLELLAGSSIQVHHRYRDQRGEFPNRPGVKWDAIIGIAEDHATVALVNWNRSEEPNLILHELAHQFDRRRGWLSDSPEWQAIHAAATWKSSYAARFATEGFADAWSDFNYSMERREALPPRVREFMRTRMQTLRDENTSSGDASVP